MRDPGAVAAVLIGAFDGDAVLVEPQRDRAAPPRVDPVDDRHQGPAAEAGRDLADDGVYPGAFNRQSRCAGDDGDAAAARAVAAEFAVAIETAVCDASGGRPRRQPFAGLARQ